MLPEGFDFVGDDEVLVGDGAVGDLGVTPYAIARSAIRYRLPGRPDELEYRLDPSPETTFTYNADGSTVTTDPRGNETHEVYNQGVRVSVTRAYGTALAGTNSYTYDPDTQALTGQVDPNGNTTTYTVGSSGNELTVTNTPGRTTTDTYNSFNQLLTTQNGNGVTTTNTYNSNGDKTSTKTPYGTGHRETDFTTGTRRIRAT